MGDMLINDPLPVSQFIKMIDATQKIQSRKKYVKTHKKIFGWIKGWVKKTKLNDVYVDDVNLIWCFHEYFQSFELKESCAKNKNTQRDVDKPWMTKGIKVLVKEN